MSIFSSIKKSRQSAKSYNAKLAEQKKKEDTATPYRHVPTHAATDAFASAPPSWRDADRERIVEQNHRRSAMAASGHHMNMPGTPRVGSSLSYVAYPSSGTASPMVPPMPRAYSYSGMPTPQNLGRESMYGVPQMAYSQPLSLKGKEVTRWPIYEAPDQDTPFGKDAQSVAESSSESSSSRDNLEMRSGQPKPHVVGVAETRWDASPKRSRRKSEPLTNSTRGNVPIVKDPRPPPSTRGFSSIPSSAVPTPLMVGKLPGPLPSAVASPTSHTAPSPMTPGLAMSPQITSANGELAVQAPPLQASRDSSAASLPGLTPTSSRLPVSVPDTPNVSSPVEFPFPAVASPAADADMTDSPGAAPSSAPLPLSKPKEQRASRATRFTELERIESGPEASDGRSTHTQSRAASQAPSQRQVVNRLPEAAVASEAEVGKKSKGKKPRKGGNKLVKKQRVASSAGGH